MKICIWMNMPSHHQSAFFSAIEAHSNIDLQVRYYEKVPETRKRLGWQDGNNLASNQTNINNAIDLDNSLPDWKERIHVIPGFSSVFLKELIDLIIKEDVQWIHWSERSGVGLAKFLNFNYPLIDLLYPVFLKVKGYKAYAQKVNRYALGSFAIGELAKKDFIKWGIDSNKIEFLPYSLDALPKPKEISCQLVQSSELLFMHIGALDERKGIIELLQAFRNLSIKSAKWKLALVGDDRSNGQYKEQAIKLGIEDQVIFTGAVQSNKINEYMDQADVFVLPTLFDGWGAVLNEAASLGKPLISTDQAGAAYHMIKDGENGFMVEAKNIKDLSRAMQFYVNHPEKIALHGNKSIEIFQNYTPEKSAILFIENVEKFLRQR